MDNHRQETRTRTISNRSEEIRSRDQNNEELKIIKTLIENYKV